ncbi:MAG TPA: TonB-dependent receptor [Candidatus Acidoferrum sp.]
MNRFLRLFTMLCALLTLGVVNLVAQTDKGSISGHVTDTSGAVLQGASIELQPTGIIVVSDKQGGYFVNALNPGTYTITVTYVGFSLFTKVFEIKAGQTTTLDVNMEVTSQKDQVLVTAERASGEAEEVNRQRTADNIMQVLTNEVIISLPNANIADAVGRLPSVSLERDEGEGKYVQVRGTEPRLTNGTIDGVSIPSPESGARQIKFDAIPADIVESVEINKTLQANMDGDGIGGSVNLVTKTATERPTVSIFGLGGMIPIEQGRNNFTTTATVGQRFGSSKKFGVLGGFSYDWEGRGIDDTEPVPDINNFGTPQQQRWFDSADLRAYQYYRSRYGVAGSADYQIGQNSNLYLRGLFSDFHNFGDRWVYTLNDNSTGSNINLLNGSGGAPSFNNSTRRPRYIISSLVLGGKHVLASTWFSWDISGSFASENDNGYGQGSFGVPTPSTFTSACTYDAAASGQTAFPPHWSPACFTEAYNPALYVLRDFNISRGKTAQVNFQLAGAMGKRYHIGSHLATIEIGGKFRNAHKYDHAYSDDYAIPTIGGTGPDQNDVPPSSQIPFTLFPSSAGGHSYYHGGATYPLGPFADYSKTMKYVLANPGQFNFSTGAAGAPNFYNYIEQVSAGYVMNTIDFNKFRFIAGLRVEGTNLDTLGWDSTANSGNGALTLKGGGDYTRVLPSGALRYALTPNTNIRLVYSRALSRPNASDIAQGFVVNNAASGPGSPGDIFLGNAKLKAEAANNYDILFEHYLNPFGAIQAGAFYKSLYDPIVQVKTEQDNFTPQNFPTGTYRFTQSVNAGSAHLFGFEIAYLQRFSFLPGWLSGFGLSGNYSYTDSGTGGLFDRLDHPHLLRQAPNTWNISPTYDRGRFSYRLGLSYNDANIFSYQYFDGSAQATVPDAKGPTPGGLKGPNSDTYLYAHFQIDMQGSVRLEKGFTFIASILNVNNEVFGFYNGSSPYMIQREFYKPTYSLGLRWSPTHEK